MIDLHAWRRNAARRRDRALQHARTLKRQLEEARGVDVPLVRNRVRRLVVTARTAHREWRFLTRSLRQQDELKRLQDAQHERRGFDPRECESPPKDEHAHRNRAWDSLHV